MSEPSLSSLRCEVCLCGGGEGVGGRVEKGCMTLHPRVWLVPCVGRGISTFSVQIVVGSIFTLALPNSFLVLGLIL